VPGGHSLPPIAASASRVAPGSGFVPLRPTPLLARYQPSYAAPSIAQSSVTAQGQFSSFQGPPTFPPMRPPILNFAQGSRPGAGHYGYMTTNGPSGIEPASSQYPNPLFSRQPIHQQLPPPGAPGAYNPNTVQLPPILPAPPGASMGPAGAQQQRHFQPQLPMYGNHPSQMAPRAQPARGEADERDPKRPRMDIQRVLGPR